MKRPADQAKLLFLYLLRSSAEALATQNPATSSAAATSSKIASTATNGAASSQLLDGHISLRLARRADVPSIQRCNLATLPENYNANFYVNHMRLFPELALVAEHIPPPSPKQSSQKSGKLFGNYDPNASQNSNNPQIIGYVLGKVDQKPIQYPPRQFLYPPSTAANLDDDDDESLLEHLIESQNIPRTETLGHVTSLAVLSNYRRRGLAATLMKQLHKHMRDVYHADAVGLHVRVSNKAATRLYCEGMGYEVADVIPQYYQDGEDAYFMKKVFGVDEEEDMVGEEEEVESLSGFEEFDAMGAATTTTTSNRRWGVGGKVRRGLSNLRLGLKRGEGSALNATKSRSRVWESGPVQFRLPRTVVDFSNDGDTASLSSSSSSLGGEEEENNDVYDEEQQPQILTGNM